MSKYSPSIQRMISAFAKLPGIGPKTAQRLCFHLLAAPEAQARELGEAILAARAGSRFCSECCNLTDVDPCPLCSDEHRDRNTICVVESPADVAAIERSDSYRGLYHVLHGAISPAEHRGMEDVKIYELMARLHRHPEVEELILANNATIEGEATAMFISQLLSNSGIRISRIASGIPIGGNLEHADEVTLGHALEGRRILHRGGHALRAEDLLSRDENKPETAEETPENTADRRSGEDEDEEDSFLF